MLDLKEFEILAEAAEDRFGKGDGAVVQIKQAVQEIKRLRGVLGDLGDDEHWSTTDDGLELWCGTDGEAREVAAQAIKTKEISRE